MNRRSLLAGTGAAVTAGLAGCLNLGPVRTRTVSRTVDAAGVDALGVRTDVGDVDVRVPATLNAALDVRTDVGEVANSGVEVSVTESGRRRLVGTLGSGGDTLRVRANVGDVTLRSS